MDPSDDETDFNTEEGNNDFDEEVIVEVYTESSEKEVIKPLINTSQISSIHNKVAVRTKVSNYEEMILAFEYYLEKIGIFTQPEAIEMKQKFFQLIEDEHTDYKQYSILIPLFFIYAYCLKKRIAFPKSFKKAVAIEVYTKKTCNELMEVFLKKFCVALNVPVRINYNWEFYIRGFMMLIRSILYSVGSSSGISTLTVSDDLFLSNEHDGNSVLRRITEVVKLESYRLLAIGILKNNSFNSSDFDYIFDLHIKSLITILRPRDILTTEVMDKIEDMFKECPSNGKLLSLYNLEEESYINSQIVEVSIVKQFMDCKVSQ
jgi:hypothetical protein